MHVPRVSICSAAVQQQPAAMGSATAIAAGAQLSIAGLTAACCAQTAVLSLLRSFTCIGGFSTVTAVSNLAHLPDPRHKLRPCTPFMKMLEAHAVQRLVLPGDLQHADESYWQPDKVHLPDECGLWLCPSILQLTRCLCDTKAECSPTDCPVASCWQLPIAGAVAAQSDQKGSTHVIWREQLHLSI